MALARQSVSEPAPLQGYEYLVAYGLPKQTLTRSFRTPFAAKEGEFAPVVAAVADAPIYVSKRRPAENPNRWLSSFARAMHRAKAAREARPGKVSY